MRRILTSLFFILTMTTVMGSVLLGAECPSNIYAHEVFQCSVYVTSYRGDFTVKLFIHDAEGLFEVSNPQTIEISVIQGTIKEITVEAWSKDAGVDALVVDAEFDGRKMGTLVPLRFVNPSVAVDFQPPTVEAGRSHTFTVIITGEAVNVRVWLESPSSSVVVSDPVDLGDLSGEEKAEFIITPVPTAVGYYKLYLNVTYVDERGMHHLRYEVPLWVNPSVVLVGLLIGGLFAAVFVLYWLYRKKKGEIPSNEAQ